MIRSFNLNLVDIFCVYASISVYFMAFCMAIKISISIKLKEILNEILFGSYSDFVYIPYLHLLKVVLSLFHS